MSMLVLLCFPKVNIFMAQRKFSLCLEECILHKFYLENKNLGCRDIVEFGALTLHTN